MAHNLNIVNGVASMAYVGETPWHTLGQHVDGNGMTAQEVITKAGLGYHVDKVPLFAAVSATCMVPVSDKYAMVRTDTNIPLGVVGERYTAVQNVDAFAFFDAITGAGEAMYKTAGALGQGETIWLLAKLPEDIGVPGDAVQSFLLLCNSHDGSSALTARFTGVRVVCNNTLPLALSGKQKTVSIRHTSGAKGQLEDAHRVLGIAARERDEAQTAIESLLARTTTKLENLHMTKQLFDVDTVPDSELGTRTRNIMDEVLHLAYHGRGNDGKTLWSWVNGVAEWVDYKHGGSKDATDKAESALFGSGYKLKERSMSIASALLQG